MKRLFLFLSCALICTFSTYAQSDGPDPNFHIYLCFGQSNMEGNALAEDKDKEYVDPRFQMMACVNQTKAKRKKGEWYTAYPPLCREMYFGLNLTPADYFGREMVANLPENIKVGVLNVAVGGASIDLFDEDKCAAYIKTREDWFQDFCKEYNNNPYKVLVDMAKKAQKKGVIKGILLHQGCSDNGAKDWPVRVKRVYIRLLNDLGLNEEEVPLLIGETLRGGYCEGHNSIIAKTHTVIPNSYVISSEGCIGNTGTDEDHLHFKAEGYRELGRRYARKMLELLGPDYSGQKKEIDFDTSETYFPMTIEAFNPCLYLEGTFKAAKLYNRFTGKERGNFGGWRYSKGADFSNYKYLVLKLYEEVPCKATFKIFDTDDYLNPCGSYEIPKNKTEVVIPLDEMTTDGAKKLDLSHIYMVGFEFNGTNFANTTNAIKISEMYLSTDDPATGIESLQIPQTDADIIYYDMLGKPVQNPTNGIYIRSTDNKKVLLR